LAAQSSTATLGATPRSTEASSAGWLRSRRFDLNFIVATAALAILTGWAVMGDPALWGPVLFLDLWLLGYHHVISTYTRLCFDRESFRAHRFHLFVAPPIVLVAVFALAAGFGLWMLLTIYLYWQWFHYTRQSFGIAQIYRRNAAGRVTDGERFGRWTFYLLPLWGILHRSHQAPESFLGVEIRTIPVPELVVHIVGAVALVTLTWRLWRRVVEWRRGALPLAYTLYMLSHFVVFYVGYVAIDDINYGWLTTNIWHNAQYIAFVWLFNTKRFRDGIDVKARFLSVISQPRNYLAYGAVCLAITTVVYAGIKATFAGLIPLAIIYQTINFHHYVVEA
jgi:hypothetical protein